MRFFEFNIGDRQLEKFIMILRNFQGRAASKKAPSKLNWNAVQQVAKASGAEVTADYETFKVMYDSSPALQKIVKNFNADGLVLDVPGSPDADKEPTQGGETSQDAVDATAATAAPQQLAQQTA